MIQKGRVMAFQILLVVLKHVIIRRVLSSGKWRRVIWWKFSDVSKKRTVPLFRVEEFTKQESSE
jgi:hypothetical protein